jgi:hypothetical protein
MGWTVLLKLLPVGLVAGGLVANKKARVPSQPAAANVPGQALAMMGSAVHAKGPAAHAKFLQAGAEHAKAEAEHAKVMGPEAEHAKVIGPEAEHAKGVGAELAKGKGPGPTGSPAGRHSAVGGGRLRSHPGRLP